jgi:RHS repeat-associated protein
VLFDALNRGTVTIDAANGRTTSLFDAAGNMTGLLNANSTLLTFVYDALNRQTVTVDGLGNRTTALFDAAGNLTGALDANAHLTQFIFDVANRQTATVDSTGNRTTSTLDPAGNATAVTDPLNHTTSYLFDALNRNTVTIDALSFRTTTLIDAVGNVTQITDAQNNTTTFAFDADNRKISQTDPSGKTATFAYDALGLMTGTTDRDGRSRTFSYDADNRLITETWFNSSGSAVNTLTYSFDPNGNLLTGANNNGTYTMSYDALNRTTVVNEPFGQSLTFSYDHLGNRTLVQDSQGGTITSVYDAGNELTSRQFTDSSATFSAGLTYTGTHQLSTIMRYNNMMGTGNIASTTFLYDAADRVTSIQHQNTGGTSLASFLYSYDGAGRVTVETDNGALKTYGYDNVNQLLGDGTNTFSYDGTGNRKGSSYTTNAGNELASDGTYNYTYDNEGNEITRTRISDGDVWTYGYDNLNHLTSAVEKTSGGTTEQSVTYKYDVFGNRIEKDVTTTSTTTTRFGYDGWKVHLDALGQAMTYTGTENWDVWADLDGNNHLLTHYLRGDQVDQLFARVDGGTPYWLLTDRLGSLRTVLDNSAAVKDQVTYDGWGNATQTNSTYGGRYLWTGRELDVETGLQYNRARYYDPHSGRWLTQDPMGFDAGDSNLYRYVRNGFTGPTDPTGALSFTEVTNDDPERWVYPANKVATITMNVSVAFTWTGKWTKDRKDTFINRFPSSVEDTWNKRSIYISSPKDTRWKYVFEPNYLCLIPPIRNPFNPGDWVYRKFPLPWIPQVKVTVIDKGVADFLIQVQANPTKKFIVSSAIFGPAVGTGKVVAWLDEADVDKRPDIDQVPAAHEFGHLLGLPHPGKRGAPDEYTADPRALMGKGSQLRPAYFAKWVAQLNKSFPDKAPYEAKKFISGNVLFAN